MSNDNNNDKNKIRRKQVSSSNNKTKSTTNKANSNTNRTKPTTSRINSSSSKNNNNKDSNKKKDKFKILRVAGILFLVILVLGVAGGTGLVFASLKDVQPVTKALLDEKTYQTTKIYYANGDLLSNAPSQNKKEPIELDQMPKDLINAIVAIEDERFYEHNGVDWIGLARSVVKTLTGTTQGGSTIPMQVSKMLLTTDKQTLTRKIKDIYYAHEMSKVLTKNEILEVYLNNFFVGKGMAGVGAGAHGYFSKTAEELSLAECALLAGSTKNPSRYSAYSTAKLEGNETKEDLENRLLFFINTSDDNLDDPTDMELDMVDKIYDWGLCSKETYNQLKSGTMVVRKAANNPEAKKRQEIVLAKMLELGYITQAEYDKAKAEEIKIKLPKAADKVSSSVEDLIEYNVIDALVAQGNTRDEAYNLFYNGGLIIETTIDPKMQDALEEEYDDNSNFPGHRVDADGMTQPQSSMVILDYRTGQIKALVGGRHITGRKTLNRATYPQQPGSTIKPLSVYTPAIDTLKITQGTALSDTRGGYKFKENNKWNPSTTTAGKGSMSLRKALAYSSNPIAIKTAEMLGDSYEECIDVMIDYLRNFGITTVQADDHDRSFASLTLGGMSKGISPLEMASAYGALANGGVYIEPTIFTTIKAYDGTLIVKSNPEEFTVVDPEVAYVVTDMLKAVITEGIGGKAKLSNGMPVAGKTGTTNSALDVWFVGYTPYYVGATYIGDDAGRKDPNTGKTIPRKEIQGGSGSAAKLWSKVMSKIHENLTVTKFKVPDNIYFTKINLIDGGKSATGSNAAFIKGTAPSRYTSQPSVQKPVKKEEEKEDTTVPPPTTEDGNTGTTNPDNSNNNTNNDGNAGTTNPDNNNNNNNNSTPNNGGNTGTTNPDNNNDSTPNDGGNTGATNNGGTTNTPNNVGNTGTTNQAPTE